MPFIIDDLIIAIGIALAAVGSIVLVEIAILALEELISWFNSIETINENDIGFTVKKAIEDDKVTVIQGVFNKRTNQVTRAREIVSNKVDDKINEFHRNHQVVIYE